MIKKIFQANFLFALGFLLPVILFSNPSGGQVQKGDVSINSNGTEMAITQTSDKAVIHWDDFSIAKGEKTNFIQPSSSSQILNRVVGSNGSEIYGSLKSNGTVYLINPHGIIVGPSGMIDTHGFIASTYDIQDEDFLQGKDLHFKGDSTARIINQGTILTQKGGVLLVAQEIENTGKITSTEGNVDLVAGYEVLLIPTDQRKVAVRLKKEGQIKNSGVIEAVEAKLQASGGNAYGLAIDHQGMIEAKGIENRNGKIVLISEETTAVTGNISAKNTNGLGGQIHLLGEQVWLGKKACIDASGQTGGGTILVGGDYQGFNPEIKNAKWVSVGKEVTLNADAIDSGNGGKVILWGTDKNDYYGAVSVKGGEINGDGGFVEVSSHYGLNYSGTVNSLAPAGKPGNLLLDPVDITISAAATDPVAGWPPAYFPTTSPSNLNVTDLTNALLTSAVSINSTGGSGGSGSVTINSAITSASSRSLSFTCNDIIINQSISLSNVVTINFNTQNLGSSLTLANGRAVSGNASSSVYGGSGHTAILDLSPKTSNITATISGNHGGTITGLPAFSGIEVIKLGSGTNTISATQNFGTFYLTGGTNNVTLSAPAGIGSSIVATAGTNTYTFAGGSLSGALTGGSGTDTILGPVGSAGQTISWNITGPGSGTVSSGISGGFTNIDNITARSVFVDQFVINGASASIGTINLGDGSNTVTMSSGAITTLNGDTGTNTYNINGGTITNFNGSSGADTLVMGGGAITTATLNAGNDIVTMNSGTIGTLNGTSGTNTYNINGGTITTLNGGSGTDTIVGPAGGTTWTVDAANTGHLSTYITDFNGIETLTGGAGNDTFNVSGAMGTINMGAGTNVLTMTGTTYTVGAVNGNTGTNTYNINAGTITTLTGGSGSDTIVGPAAGAKWTLTAANVGNLKTLADVSLIGTYNAIETLTGGAGNDQFTIGYDWGGTINLGAGTNSFTMNAGSYLVGTVNGDTGTNTYTLNGGTITTLNGSSGNDTITVANTVGTINLGAGTNIVNMSATGVVTAINGDTGTNTYNINGGLITTLTGNPALGTDRIVGPSGGGHWAVTANFAGNLKTLADVDLITSFTNVETLSGFSNALNEVWYINGDMTTINLSNGNFDVVTMDSGHVGTLTAKTHGGMTMNGGIIDLWTGNGTSAAVLNNNAHIGTITDSIGNISLTLNNTSSIDTIINNSTAGLITVVMNSTGTINSISATNTGQLAVYAYNGTISTVTGYATTLASTIFGSTSGSNTWEFTGGNSGRLNFGSGVKEISSFTNIKTITAQGAIDTFDVNASFNTINMGDGNDTLTLNAGTVTILTGGNGTDTIIGPAGGATWVVSGSGVGSVTGTVAGVISSFFTIENLTGGAGDDFFTIAGNMGTISLGAGNNTFQLDSGAITAVNGDTGTNTYTINGGSIGTLTAGSGISIYNINGGLITTLVGSSGSDTLRGPATGGHWNVTGNYTGNLKTLADVNLVASFSGVETLTGYPGAINEVWNIAGNITTINLSGGTGTTLLSTAGTITTLNNKGTLTIAGGDITTWNAGSGTSAVIINSGSITDIAKGAGDLTVTLNNNSTINSIIAAATGSIILNVNNGTVTTVTGGSATTNNSIIGPAGGATWTVSGNYAGSMLGTVQGVVTGFTGIQTLTGLGDNDIFSVTGSMDTINLGGGTNTLTLNAGVYTVGTVNGDTGVNTYTINGGTLTTLNGGSSGDILNLNSGSIGTILEGNGNNTYNISGGDITTGVTGGSGNDNFIFADNIGITGTINGGAGGTNTLNFSAYTALHPIIVTVTGPNSGTTSKTGNFSNIDVITGGSGNDVFTVGGNMGTINLGSGTNIFTINSGSVTAVNGNNGANTYNINGGTVTTLTGSSVSNDLYGPNLGALWDISGTDAGSLIGTVTGNITNFTNIENLFGGSGNDTFDFGNLGHITGNIDGDGGVNALDYTHYNGSIFIDIPNNQASLVDGNVFNIQNGSAQSGTLIGGPFDDTFAIELQGSVDGKGGINTIIALNVNNVWTISAPNAGSIATSPPGGTVTFINIQKLVAGGLYDLFYLQGHGFVQDIQGTGNTDILVGPNASSIWDITGVDQGSIHDGGTTTFAHIESLTGGTQNDTFVMHPGAQVTNTIDGGAGYNVLDYSMYGAPVYVDFATGTATGIGHFTNIQNVIFSQETFSSANARIIVETLGDYMTLSKDYSRLWRWFEKVLINDDELMHRKKIHSNNKSK
jgi:filamentous hemagglutinin family protein